MNYTTTKKSDDVCFANRNGVCSILQINSKKIVAVYQTCMQCPFFKTPKQYATERMKYLNYEIEYAHLSENQAKKLYENLKERTE